LTPAGTRIILLHAGIIDAGYSDDYDAVDF
jgi:hypothetical protein